MTDSQQLQIRPYARLLTMLGDQLIKNERIALVELIKNAYDADSPWAKVSFNHFDENFKGTPESKIIIEDAGDGMTLNTIKNHWLNPATPDKKKRKEKKERTNRGRVIQGEKGIGRFSILKLGSKIRIITRAKGEDVERVLDYDFSIYDDDFLFENGQEKTIYIDDLSVSLQTREPEIIKESNIMVGHRQFQRPAYGTRIEISNLKGIWSNSKVIAAYNDITQLESLFLDNNSGSYVDLGERDFNVRIHKDEEPQPFEDSYREKLNNLIENRSVIRIENGVYDNENEEFRFTYNGKEKTLKLRNPHTIGYDVFKSRFGDAAKVLDERKIECGPFKFGFFVFDFNADAPIKYRLDFKDKKIIRPHRIYLYRDNIRVYPYGDLNDDWLGIDIYRGTKSAAGFLSNDQVVGYVKITQSDNPYLKDKTNREGLIEEGNATDDFIALLKILLAHIRRELYKNYLNDLKNKNSQEVFKKAQVQNEFQVLKKLTKDNKKINGLISKAEKSYNTERQYLLRRAEITEDLAGVGISVETASHDIMAIMKKAMMIIDDIVRDSMHGVIVQDSLIKEFQSLRGMLSFIETQLKDVQLLFRSSKQRRKTIKVREIVYKVERIYKRNLKRENIDLNVNEIGSPLVAKTTDAVLLQLLLNLFDNAVYWLQQTSIREKKIEILLDGDKGQIIFSDNGPGIDVDDTPYIFEPFYTGKGDEGRGLGLYIARQLLERNDYSIELAELQSQKILSGANFVANFVSEEK